VSEGSGRDDAVVCLGMLLLDATVSKQLGHNRLPDFHCPKAACQPDTFQRSMCALAGGLYRADDPICRRECQGFAAAKAMHAEHLAAGVEPLPFWEFVRDRIEPSEADAWSQLRDWAKHEPWL
jgi:hypothetical protein